MPMAVGIEALSVHGHVVFLAEMWAAQSMSCAEFHLSLQVSNRPLHTRHYISQAVPPLCIIIINREAGYEANYRRPVNEKLKNFRLRTSIDHYPRDIPGKRFVLQTAKHIKLIGTELNQPNQFNQPTPTNSINQTHIHSFNPCTFYL